MSTLNECIRMFVAASHKAANDYRLVSCSSGNLSWRIGDDEMLVSASRSWMGELAAEQVAHLRIGTEEVLNGRTPSVESRFHAGVLRNRSDVDVVLHFQSPAATALCCTDAEDVNFAVIPEIPFYIGEVARVPYIQPGSEELANAVIAALMDRNLVMLGNHGLVTVGANFDDAIQKAVFFEMACDILLRLGERARPLPAESIQTLSEQGKGRVPGKV